MADPPSATPAGEARSSRSRSRRARAAILALSVVSTAVLVVVLGPPALRRTLIAEARGRGVELDPGAIDVELGAVHLRKSRFSLAGVRGLSGTLSHATISLRGFAPTEVSLRGVELSLAGFAPLEDLDAWAAEHRARATELPLSAEGVRVGWREHDGAPESLALVDAVVSAGPPGNAPAWTGVLQRARVVVGARELTRTDLAWALDDGAVSVGLGAMDVPSAPLRAELRAHPTTTASIKLAAAPLASIAALLGIDAGAQGVTVAGAIELRLPTGAHPSGVGGAGSRRGALRPDPQGGATPAPIAGTVDLRIEGFVLPHPKEIDGLLFGKTTLIKGEARLSQDRRAIALDRVTVSAGALTLGGSGAVVRDGSDATIDLDLAGSIPCSLLAGSAAMAHLAGPMGAFASGLARRAIAGSVAVRVRVDARASRLAAARVDPSAVVRCQLRL